MKDNKDGEGVEKREGVEHGIARWGGFSWGFEVALSWRIEGGASSTSDKADK